MPSKGNPSPPSARAVHPVFAAALLAGCLLAGFLPAGCGKSGGDTAGMERLSRETRYYNDYLGFSYAIPRGWWAYDINEYNLSRSRGEITDDIEMDIALGRYESYLYSNIWLMAFGNLENIDNQRHLGFSIDARYLDGIDGMPGFMEYFELFMLEPAAYEEYRLLDSRQTAIKGKTFELREYLVTREEIQFHVITLSTPVNNGYVLNISVDFWADNDNAIEAIIDSVTKALEFY